MKSLGKSYKPILLLIITLFIIVGLGIYKNSTETFQDTMFESRGSLTREPFFNTRNQQSGNTGNQQSGNTANQQSGNTANQQSGNTENQQSGNTCLVSGLQGDLNHITSNLSGASFDFRRYTDSSNPSSNIIMIYQKPIRSGEHTHVLAVNDSGNLVTQPEDDTNPQQRWNMVKIDYQFNLFEIVSTSSGTAKSLNHDGNFLSLKPQNSNFEGVKWRVVLGSPSQGLLACSPSLRHESVQPINDNVEDIQASRMAELLALVKKNHEHYMREVGEQRTNSSVFGTGGPLRLKINVLDDDNSLNIGTSNEGTESFQDTNSSSGTQDIVRLLNRYESRNSPSIDYSVSPNIPKCNTTNLEDYIDRRVGQCNCIV